ncbi:MAG: hypothetical protein NW220_11455, partial [Leptolyngbyaceae cyanobacterium bins.349]|nr:hypothetical protein [Leptolyngbyaceae cyanobacterium bins.349]
ACLADSFSCRVRLLGQGLRDLVFNFPYLFEMRAVGTEGDRVTQGRSHLSVAPNGVCTIPCFGSDVFPPTGLDTVIEGCHALNPGIRVFHHQATCTRSESRTQMSAWAAAIDQWMAEQDVLFVLPANHSEDTGEKSARVAEPGQSLNGLTVGCWHSGQEEGNSDWEGMGGLWHSVKPEVVIPAASAAAASAIVADMVAAIAQAFRAERCGLYRALLVHSARWLETEAVSAGSSIHNLRWMGYGQPDLDRALGNTPSRVTFFTSGEQRIKARQVHIYQIDFPQSLVTTHPDCVVLIEVTLAYTARPARTYQGHNGYLSTWLSWQSNRRRESAADFVARMVGEGEELEGIQQGQVAYKWAIGTQKRFDPQTGVLRRASRNASTLQKDWTQVKLSEIGVAFCVAVIGHEGWERSPDTDAEYGLVVSFEAIGETKFTLYELIVERTL